MLSQLCLILVAALFLHGDFALVTGEIPPNALRCSTSKVFLNNVGSLEVLLNRLCHIT